MGTYLPNGFGLHDVHGNVWEWCRNLYSTTSTTSANRVHRGGSFGSEARNARSSNRIDDTPTIRNVNLGCRPQRARY